MQVGRFVFHLLERPSGFCRTIFSRGRCQDILGVTARKQLKDIEQAVAAELGPIWRQPDRSGALIGEGWLLDQVNDSSLRLIPFGEDMI